MPGKITEKQGDSCGSAGGIPCRNESLALIAISAIFFSVLGFLASLLSVATFAPPIDLPYFGSDLFTTVPALLSIISLIGCTLYLRSHTKKSRTWSGAIPLAAVIAVAAAAAILASPLRAFPYIPFIGDPETFDQATGLFMQFLLAPAAAIFFLQAKENEPGSRSIVFIPIAVGVLSAILIFGFLVPPDSGPGAHIGMTIYEPVYWVYLMLGLPMTGCLFLARGIRCIRNPGTKILP